MGLLQFGLGGRDPAFDDLGGILPAAGQPGAGARLLGRWPEVEGLVVHGAGRGRTIGIPTANLAPTTDALPAVGVYAAWAELLADLPEPPADAASTPVVAQSRAVISRHPAAVNVGYNPTFTAAKTAGDPTTMAPLTIEAHLLPPLDSALAHAEVPSLYGHTLRLLSLPKAWSGFLKDNDRGASCLGPHSGLKMQEARFNAALAALANPELTTLILVARADQGALAEAARTSDELHAMGLNNQHLVINGVFPAEAALQDPLAAAICRREQAALAAMPATNGITPRRRVTRRTGATSR